MLLVQCIKRLFLFFGFSQLLPVCLLCPTKRFPTPSRISAFAGETDFLDDIVDASSCPCSAPAPSKPQALSAPRPISCQSGMGFLPSRVHTPALCPLAYSLDPQAMTSTAPRAYLPVFVPLNCVLQVTASQQVLL